VALLTNKHMEQPKEQPIESVQNSKNIWITVVVVIVTTLIVGGGVYAWQKSNIKKTEQSLQQQISVLQNQISQLQQVQSQDNLPVKTEKQKPDASESTTDQQQDKQTNGVKEAVLPDNVVEINGEKEFPGADWGLKSIICKQGGFDILAYAGKEVVIESSLAVGKFYRATPLDLYTIYVDNKVICKYYVDSTGMLIPGIFAVNDPMINGQ